MWMRRWRAKLEDWAKRQYTHKCEQKAGEAENRETNIGEALVAAKVLAHVRLLARVGADVHRQGGALDEALAASGSIALVRPLIGVYPVVPLQVRLAVEALFTLQQLRVSVMRSCMLGCGRGCVCVCIDVGHDRLAHSCAVLIATYRREGRRGGG